MSNNNKQRLDWLISEPLVLTIIGLNAVAIVLSGFSHIRTQFGEWISWVDYGCLLYFVAEAILKIRRNSFTNYWKRGWNKLDFIIVLGSSPLLLEPIVGGSVQFFPRLGAEWTAAGGQRDPAHVVKVVALQALENRVVFAVSWKETHIFTFRRFDHVLSAEHEELLARILDDAGELRTFVNLFVGSKNISQLEGLDTPVAKDDVLSILPAVAGGIR